MTQSETILEMLKEAPEGVPNYALADISLQYNARIWELRKLGWDIRRQRVNRRGKPSGTYLYFLKGAPTPIQPLPKLEVKYQPGILFELEPRKPIQRMDPL